MPHILGAPIKIIAANFSTFLETPMNKVFVYGTLKRNEPNHSWMTCHLNGVSRFVAEGVTRARYPLVIATRYNVPFLLDCPGWGHHVRGEVYEVDNKMLEKLDILEDHPHQYVRQHDDIRVKVRDTIITETVKCWVYFMKDFKKDILCLPYLENYTNNGPHGLRYVEIHEQDPSFDFTTELR